MVTIYTVVASPSPALRINSAKQSHAVYNVACIGRDCFVARICGLLATTFYYKLFLRHYTRQYSCRQLFFRAGRALSRPVFFAAAGDVPAGTDRGREKRFVHASRAEALKIQRDVGEPQLSELCAYSLPQRAVAEPIQVRRLHLDAGDGAMMPDPALPEGKAVQVRLRLIHHAQFFFIDGLAVGEA